MFRATVLVFLAGWIVWFWLDKPPLPHPIQDGDNQMLANFQFAFSLLKAGHLSAAYAFIWRAHYLLLSVLGGLLLAMAGSGVSGVFARRRYAIRRKVMRSPSEAQARDKTSAGESTSQTDL
jgi:hypothetical protein